MSLLRQLGVFTQHANSLRSSLGGLTQIRTATKKVSGSRTNKNDSAGRRLGPKAYENQFVQPGEIIMRQRGTKIHPGENVGIGKDHTIFALEPGYVRFYLDPFHPLRKFVGVALRKDLTLPKPHFEPSVRRFGYVPLEGAEAEKEEAHMSRKEYLAQPQLTANAEKEASKAEKVLTTYKKIISAMSPELSLENVQLGALRLQFVARKLAAGENEDFAYSQATYNHMSDVELSVRRGEITQEEAKSEINKYIDFAQKFDAELAVDFSGAIYRTLDTAARETKKADILAKLNEYANRTLSAEDQKSITALISEAGVFSAAERLQLKKQYLPKVLPVTVPGTVYEGKKVPKDAVVVRTFTADKTVETVVRTKDAFLA